MRFLLDQSSDARMIPYLIGLGHDAVRVGHEYPAGLSDVEVLALAHSENRVLITDDRDFGELVIRHELPHAGVIYLRIGEFADLDMKLSRLQFVLTQYADRLDRFLVVTEHRARIYEPG